MNKNVDYIIVGQGLAGSAIAWVLMQRGKSVMVFDTPSANQSSTIAAGIYNPITGRVLTQTWMASTLFPFLDHFYSNAEKETNKRFLHKLPVYRPFLSDEERKTWQIKAESQDFEKIRLNILPPNSFSIPNPFGGIEIIDSGYLNVAGWLNVVRQKLVEKESYASEGFDDAELVVGEKIEYKNIVAERIIFCNGIEILNSRHFGWLPVKPLKGETLSVELSFIPERIFNRGVYVVPTETKNVYRVGATYEHQPFSAAPTEKGKKFLANGLAELIDKPFRIIHQEWGIRPTSPDRRPMLGAHPANKNVFVFNGLGTKGVSLSPYFAHHLALWLEGTGDLSTEVNIYRFKALYSS